MSTGNVLTEETSVDLDLCHCVLELVFSFSMNILSMSVLEFCVLAGLV